MRPTFLAILIVAAIGRLGAGEEPIPRAQEQAPERAADRRDVGKARIELPMKQLIAADVPAQPVDRTKRVLQRPVEALVAETAESADSPELTEEINDNPSVEPGKVVWHEDFAAACRAAEESGKPVLLFHLLGQLDQRFT